MSAPGRPGRESSTPNEKGALRAPGRPKREFLARSDEAIP
jgi:hypothetical protein